MPIGFKQMALENQETTADVVESVTARMTTAEFTSSQECGNTISIVIYTACLVVGFIAGQFVATTVLKSMFKCEAKHFNRIVI